MITLVVPTRNRVHTLCRVAESYFCQRDVSEIIFVIDAGEDDTAQSMLELGCKHRDVSLKIVENLSRKGASESRNIGVKASVNEFILFCDDDEYLQADYARICLRKLLSNQRVGAVSGRRIYMFRDESQEEALLRFGDGLRRVKPFNYLTCEYANGAIYSGDKELPITNAIILTRRSLLLKYPFDSFYARGNGYREETDYQMNLFIHGYRIYATNDCHSFHLPLSEVRTGGQRVSRLKRIAWSVYYTDYFFKKYYGAYANRVQLKIPRFLALLAFTFAVTFKELLRPSIYALWVSIAARRRSSPS